MLFEERTLILLLPSNGSISWISKNKIFFCLRMWRKNGAKEPRNSTPLGNSAHAKPPPPPPPKNAGISILQTPTSPNHVAEAGARVSSPLATREQSAPIVPIPRLLHVELAHNLPHSGERASECNEEPGTTTGARCWGPHSAMEAMNPGIPGKGGQCGPLP